MEERKKQILLEKLTEYNKTVNDVSKFQLNKREEGLFCEIMQQFADEYHSKQLRQRMVLYEGGFSRTTLSSKHEKRKRKNERGYKRRLFKMEGVMKTAEEWFDAMITGSPDIKEVISKIQKEAYNQALEDACNHDKVDVYYDENVGYCTLQQSILKLKK